MGYVYLIEYDACYKIGKTRKSVEHRISSMQFPNKPSIIAIFESAMYSELEKYLHKRLNARKIRNEWFCFDNNEQALKLVTAYVNEFLVDGYKENTFNEKQYSMEDILACSSVSNENTFWHNYNIFKSNVSKKEWNRIKLYFNRNSIYKRWQYRKLTRKK